MKTSLLSLSRPARRARPGMVLIEVVIALALFAAISLSLVTALDSAFDAANERNQIDVALRGLENQMSLLHEARVSPGETDLPDDGSGILYHVSVEQEQMQDQKMQQVPNMYRATISAKWTLNGQADERDASELIYQP